MDVTSQQSIGRKFSGAHCFLWLTCWLVATPPSSPLMSPELAVFILSVVSWWAGHQSADRVTCHRLPVYLVSLLPSSAIFNDNDQSASGKKLVTLNTNRSFNHTTKTDHGWCSKHLFPYALLIAWKKEKKKINDHDDPNFCEASGDHLTRACKNKPIIPRYKK